MGLSWPLFLYFCLFFILQLAHKCLLILGFERRISGVRSDRSANCATTTARFHLLFKSIFYPTLQLVQKYLSLCQVEAGFKYFSQKAKLNRTFLNHDQNQILMVFDIFWSKWDFPIMFDKPKESVFAVTMDNKPPATALLTDSLKAN